MIRCHLIAETSLIADLSVGIAHPTLMMAGQQNRKDNDMSTTDWRTAPDNLRGFLWAQSTDAGDCDACPFNPDHKGCSNGQYGCGQFHCWADAYAKYMDND